MGHQHFGVLPATKKWQAVIALIAGGAPLPELAAAISTAAEASLEDYSNDRVVRRTFFLLTQIPLAARKPDFVAALGRVGLQADNPNLIRICIAYLEEIDRVSVRHRSDFGEMAALSAVESLQAVAGRSLNDLFGVHSSSADATQQALADLATVKQFGLLARDFFSRLLRRHLDYYLSRELPNHVGVNNRFSSVREHRDFENALELHCREAAHITTQFAGEWLSKANFEGGVTEKKVGGFLWIAFQKLRREIEVRGKADD
jgi:hypothetical protein